MKISIVLLLFFLLHQHICGQTVQSNFNISQENERLRNTHWKGRRVAFLGDSITDKSRVGTSRVYWEYLTDILLIDPIVYGKNGHTWKDVLRQSETMVNDSIDNISTIVLFAGTNDFNASVPMGSLFKESLEKVNYNGEIVQRRKRSFAFDDETYYGRINNVFNYLKSKYPEVQIIVLTPLHRGFAQFATTNIQPDEQYANAEGLFISDYSEALKLAALQWSIPIVDLYGSSGLQPLVSSNSMFFADKHNDLLHPNSIGHERIARFIAYQMLLLP